MTTQITPGQARVVDPILTTAAQGYKNAQMVGMALFPRVPVSLRGGKIITFRKEDFMLYNTLRAPGSHTKRVQYGYDGSSYTLESHSLEGTAPIELIQEAQNGPGIDMGMMAVTKTQNIIALRLEYAQATLALTASNYPSSNKTTLSGTAQWSDPGSDPIGDVEAGKEAIRQQIGLRPNTLEISALVFSALKKHPSILDRIKYTGRDVPSLELLASLFGVQQVVLGDAVYVDGAGTMHDVWGKHAVLAYTAVGTLAAQGEPTYGYTYALNGYPIVEEPYYDRSAKSWVYPVTDEVQPVIAGNTAGYLIQNAVA